ncbi:vacuolar-sorting protein SNF8-like isoform X2 [Penaeus chinensis]|nr:vacuolar-sorting protein SNF8-like isoform X2 [Penaeus chinensis]XP_047493279.1 vacuolar-sorting protein SNF8-like isoform X2 [Penaeus chinensis]
MRRRAGVGAIQRQKIQQDKFKEKGSEIQENQLEQMTLQMEKFRENLEDFAAKHKNEIKKNPQFRKQFQEMCASIGVDPLASGKGFWCEMLGVGDFYYELGVQIVELCVATSHRNGGVLSMDEVLRKLNQRRRQDNQISADDAIRAVKKLRVLGSGMEVVASGSSQFIYSIPGELSMDHTTLLQQAEKAGHLTVASTALSLGWTNERAGRTLDHLLRVGVAWRDDQDRPASYWFPAFFQQCAVAE